MTRSSRSTRRCGPTTTSQALRAGLADGTIDAVATDHAPHASHDKDHAFADAAFGMLGLQTALGVVIETMIRPGRLDWAGLADRMSVRPANIGRVAGHGRPIAVGEPANLTLLDPAADWLVVPHQLASIAANTPFAGRSLPGSGPGHLPAGSTRPCSMARWPR